MGYNSFMPEVEFILNNHFLASYIIANYQAERFNQDTSRLYKKDIVNFRNLAWNKSEFYPIALGGRFGLFGIIPSTKTYKYKEFGESLDKYLDELTDSDEFKILYEQTKQSFQLCEKEWISNYKKTNDYIESLGINLEGKYKVWLGHPGLL